MAEEKSRPPRKRRSPPQGDGSRVRRSSRQGGGRREETRQGKGPQGPGPATTRQPRRTRPPPKAPPPAPAPADKPVETVGGVAKQPTAEDLLKEELGALKIRKAKGSKNITSGLANILASFNNTVVTITDLKGNVIAWSSAGKCNFRGSRKSTAYAAQIVAQDAARNAMAHGLKDVADPRQRPRPRPRLRHPGPPGHRPRDHLDHRRDPGAAQRLPPRKRRRV